MKNEKINIPGEEAIRIMRLLEFSDSAFPVGAFSFSNGLETATFEKYVYDKNTLEQYAACAARQAAFCDGIAANIAYKALLDNDYEKIGRAHV